MARGFNTKQMLAKHGTERELISLDEGYSIETPIISIFYVWVFGHITTYGQTDRLTMFSYTHSDVVTDSHKSFSNVSCGCESWTGLLCLSIRWRTGRFVGEPAWRRCTSAPTVSA